MALLAIEASGQSVVGTVQDSKGSPVPYATVFLLNGTDSSLVKGAIATESGHFVIENTREGTFRVAVSAVGFEKRYSTPITLATGARHQLPSLVLTPEAHQLTEVNVLAKKPLFEQQMDKLVVNVENMLTAAGGSALDVLERSPGVTVNRQNGGLSLNGKNGVLVMIDGRLNRLPMEAVVQMLSGMNASNIDKVELITNPPAQYDAEGDAGLINIVLKKNINEGTNGSYTLSAGLGRFERLNGSLLLNYRKKNLNLFGDYSVLHSRTWMEFIGDMRISNEGIVSLWDFNSQNYHRRQTHNARLGFDYSLSPNTVIGGQFAGFFNGFYEDATRVTNIRQNGPLMEQSILTDDGKNIWYHQMVNANVRHTFAGKQQLSLDVDYLIYNNQNPHDYTNLSAFPQLGTSQTDLTNITKESPIRIWVLKADYSQALGKQHRLDFGAKSTRMQLSNDLTVSKNRDGIWRRDAGLSQLYDLDEVVDALYANGQFQLPKGQKLQAGLRYEYTRTDLGEPGEPPVVRRRYGSFFPSIFWTKDLNKTSSLRLAYSRRIARPQYSLLAPWVIFTSPYTFVTGNPNLLPTFTDAVEATYRFKSSYLFTVRYTHDRNALDRFRIRVDSTSGTSVGRPENINSINGLTTTFSFPVRLTNWWHMQTNLTGYGQAIETLAEGKPVSLRIFAGNGLNASTFTLSKTWTAELALFYTTPSFMGIARVKAMGSVNAGLKKKFKSGGNLLVNVTDLFWTNRLRVITDNPAVRQVSSWGLNFEPRVVQFTYTNTFSKKTVNAANRRATGSEEERSRGGRIQLGSGKSLLI
ncbi:TonB dependent receptor [Dyadobacter pollutisoli]|uniref:TonB dependent receptor n=1 Tax=Dyadobacter pollutisoli TaxID=2910158 RepID=A0A9E8NBA5_9BACT|nr:TonB dependent receptor [Dyadobacter pollutisoli]WAC13400.1 TonB dependent receptor [Dyadobacter pollutisoli]